MANTKSAQKAMRQTERRTAQNRAARSSVRTFVKKATLAVTEPGGSTPDGLSAAEIVRQAVKALDKAAKRGIIHPNAAARRKSRLMSRVHLLSVAGERPAAAEPTPTRARGRSGGSESRTTARTTRTPARGATTRKTSSKKDS